MLDVNYARDGDCIYLLGIKKANYTNCYELWETDGTCIILLRAHFIYKRFRFLLGALRFEYTRGTQKIRQTYTTRRFPLRTHQKLQTAIPNKPAKYGLKLYTFC